LKTDQRRLEEWIIFFDFCAYGKFIFPQLRKRFNVSNDRIEAIIDEKMHMREVIEKVHGSNWVNVVCWE
jgi:hypothetical protein